MNQALVPIEEMNLSDTMTLAEVLCKSGFFSDTKQASQAVVKVLAGREIGFGPVASMVNVHIIQGKPSIGANLIAAKVKGHPRYDYRVTWEGDKACQIEFFQLHDGKRESLGMSTFTIDDAKQAGLLGKDNWKKYPRNLLFARAISNGARWYCPDVFSGVTVYTPEEMGLDLTDENGDVVDGEVTPVEPLPEPQVEQPAGNGAKYATPEARAKAMMEQINYRTTGAYNAPKHMLNAIRIETGDKNWTWPELDDEAGWTKAANLALAHAKKEAA